MISLHSWYRRRFHFVKAELDAFLAGAYIVVETTKADYCSADVAGVGWFCNCAA